MNPIKKLSKFLTSILLVYFSSVTCGLFQPSCDDSKIIQSFKRVKVANQIKREADWKHSSDPNIRFLNAYSERVLTQDDLKEANGIGTIFFQAFLIPTIMEYFRKYERIKWLIQKETDKAKIDQLKKKAAEIEKKVFLADIKQIKKNGEDFCVANLSLFYKTKYYVLPIIYQVIEGSANFVYWKWAWDT